jgi:BirA family biotin operon repressor/biotin-[acetyl-CoA-carboxylase] ligase
VTVVDETGSTNADLLDAASHGAPDRSVLMARHQTAGRGRLERTWEAPPGSNLLVSVLFRQLPPHVHQLTQRVALAACAACQALTGVNPQLKWPNDLVIGDAKLGGILAQAGTVDGELAYVVVGLGLNVGWAPDGAVCLADVGASVRPEDLLAEVLRQLDLLPTDDDALASRYRAGLATLGQRVRVHLPGGVGDLDGTAIGVEIDGQLVVLDDCGVNHRIDTAEVVHLRHT